MSKKKRVAIYYDNRFGRNDGSPLYYFNVLKKDPEVEVMHLIPNGDTSKYGKFDYHLWVDWGEDGLNYPEWEIPNDGGEKIYIASDTHLGKDYRFKMAKKFDFAFFNQLSANEEFEGESWWLPHAAEPEAYPKTKHIKKYDVCFIGHMQDVKNNNDMTRIDALDVLFKAFPNFYFGTRNPSFPDKHLFEHAAEKYAKSKIVFNISIKDDVNMRVFEALSSGSMLLTNEVPTLERLFENKKHLVTYSNYKEMIDKAKYYIDNDLEREMIADAGHEEFMMKHTYKHRWDQVKRVIKLT